MARKWLKFVILAVSVFSAAAAWYFTRVYYRSLIRHHRSSLAERLQVMIEAIERGGYAKG